MPYKNREDQIRCQRRWYQKDKENIKAKNYARRREIKKWFRELKKTLQCTLCPEFHPACLDFHHKENDKELEISEMVAQGFGRKRILEEMKKCKVLCSNCHKKLHHSLERD